MGLPIRGAPGGLAVEAVRLCTGLPACAMLGDDERVRTSHLVLLRGQVSRGRLSYDGRGRGKGGISQ